MADASATYGFTYSDDAGLSDRKKLHSTSLKQIAPLPLSAYEYSGSPTHVPFTGGPVFVTEDGEEITPAPGIFMRYLSSSYVFANASAEFEDAFGNAAVRYKCTIPGQNGGVTDFWLLFDTNVSSSMINFGTHPPAAWVVKALGEAESPSAARIALRISTLFQAPLSIPGAEGYRWFFAAYPESGQANSSCCFVTESLSRIGTDDSSLSPDQSERVTNIGVIQHKLRGATDVGGTNAYAGFLVRLDNAGKINASMIPGSDADVIGLLVAEADERKNADEMLRDAIEGNSESIVSLGRSLGDHVGDKNNPHEVTAAQIGLGNVDDTSDLDKPISTAAQEALDLKIARTDAENAFAPKYYDESNGITLVDKVAELDENKQDKLTFDLEPTEGSSNPVTSGGVANALSTLSENKQDKLAFDPEPTEGSSNPVTSGGVAAALSDLASKKQDKLTFDSEPTKDSQNPVTSGGIKAYVDAGFSRAGEDLFAPKYITPDGGRQELSAVATRIANTIDGTAIAIGHAAGISGTQGIAIGESAITTGRDGVALGRGTQVTGPNGGAFGPLAIAGASGAYQIGTGTNSVADSLQFLDWPLVGRDGYIVVDRLRRDARPTEGSGNVVTSGGVFAAIQDIIDEKIDPAFSDFAPKYYDESNKVTLVGKVAELDENKQDKLAFDPEPTEGSSNPVTSSGIRAYVNDAVNRHFTIAEELDPEARDAVQAKGIARYLQEHYAPKYYDESNGITLLDEVVDLASNKQDKLNFITDLGQEGAAESDNPVTAKGIVQYVTEKVGNPPFPEWKNGTSLVAGKNATNQISSTRFAENVIALGNTARVSNDRAIAIGGEATVETDATAAIAIGSSAQAQKPNTIVIGPGVQEGVQGNLVTGKNVAIGSNTKLLDASSAVAIGPDIAVSASNGVAIGPSVQNRGNFACAIGCNAISYGLNGIALGLNSKIWTGKDETDPIDGDLANCIAIGTGTDVQASDAICVGNGAKALIASISKTSSCSIVCMGKDTQAVVDSLDLATNVEAICLGGNAKAVVDSAYSHVIQLGDPEIATDESNDNPVKSRLQVYDKVLLDKGLLSEGVLPTYLKETSVLTKDQAKKEYLTQDDAAKKYIGRGTIIGRYLEHKTVTATVAANISFYDIDLKAGYMVFATLVPPESSSNRYTVRLFLPEINPDEVGFGREFGVIIACTGANGVTIDGIYLRGEDGSARITPKYLLVETSEVFGSIEPGTFAELTLSEVYYGPEVEGQQPKLSDLGFAVTRRDMLQFASST